MKTEKKQIQKFETVEETIKNAERYILTVAARFGVDEHLQDLQQIGRLAVLESFQNHQDDKGSFHSYTIALMRGRMLNYINNNVKVIRIPESQLNVNHINHNPNNPTQAPTVNTSTPIGNEGTTTVGDMLQDDVDDDEQDDEAKAISARLKQTISSLKVQHQKIITMRYTDELTLEQIGDNIGMSKQAVSQQLAKAMNQLKKDFGVDGKYKNELRHTKEYQNNEYKNYKKYDQSKINKNNLSFDKKLDIYNKQ